MLYATPGDTYWIDTGTPAKYIEAQLDLIDGRREPRDDAIDQAYRGRPDASVERSVAIAGASVGAGASCATPWSSGHGGGVRRPDRPVHVGPRARIGAGRPRAA